MCDVPLHRYIIGAHPVKAADLLTKARFTCMLPQSIGTRARWSKGRTAMARRSTREDRMKRLCSVLLVSVLVLQTAACGIILYPERKGQRGGRIDPAIAILDGVGLLFFIIPGVIAFAVDFATGAIYLPGSGLAGDADTKRMALEGEITAERLEKLLADEYGNSVPLDDAAIHEGRRKDIVSFVRLLNG